MRKITEKDNYRSWPVNQKSKEHHLAKRFLLISFKIPETASRIKREEPAMSTEPEPTMNSNPEPGPHWPSAFETWGKAWDLHIYLFAVLYLLTAGTSASGLVYDVIANHGIKGLKLTLYLTLLFIGCSRAFILFFDPYSSRGILGLLTTYITWSLGLPCVLVALGLLLLVFADATKMNLAPPRFQKLSTAMGAMVFNILIVITTDLIFLLTSKGFILLILCYVYFLLLGLILTAGFLRIGCQISNNSAAQIYGDGGLSRLRILAFISATLNMLFLGVQTYSVIQFDVLSENPRAWPWYAVQTLLRALEVSMCFVMLAIVFNNRFSSFLFFCKKFLPNRFNNTVSPLPPGFAKT